MSIITNPQNTVSNPFRIAPIKTNFSKPHSRKKIMPWIYNLDFFTSKSEAFTLGVVSSIRHNWNLDRFIFIFYLRLKFKCILTLCLSILVCPLNILALDFLASLRSETILKPTFKKIKKLHSLDVICLCIFYQFINTGSIYSMQAIQYLRSLDYIRVYWDLVGVVAYWVSSNFHSSFDDR